MIKVRDKAVAYEGRQFTIEWYFDAKGYSQAREYAYALGHSDLSKLTWLFTALGDAGRIQSEEKFRSEGDKIFVLKPKPHRFLSFFQAGRKIIVTNAFIKKQDKLPPQEKERALRCMKDYEQRVKARTYYETETH